MARNSGFENHSPKSMNGCLLCGRVGQGSSDAPDDNGRAVAPSGRIALRSKRIAVAQATTARPMKTEHSMVDR